VLLTGTLNRVMIVELGMSTSLVAAMVSLPLLFAPLRALIGFRSDHHASLLGWKRVPYLWFGTLLQFGGLAILPFALLVMTGGGTGPAIFGQIGAALGFLMVGAGMHTTQTAGLALATDLAPDDARPRVVALLYVMLVLGMMVSAIVIGRLLADFTPTKLVQLIQGAAMLTVVLNLVAMWKQEARGPRPVVPRPYRPNFGAIWAVFIARPRTLRLLVAVGLGAAAFSMQDVLLEPYGGQVLGMGRGAGEQRRRRDRTRCSPARPRLGGGAGGGVRPDAGDPCHRLCRGLRRRDSPVARHARRARPARARSGRDRRCGRRAAGAAFRSQRISGLKGRS